MAEDQNNLSQVPSGNSEPEDIFGGIESLRVEETVSNPQQSISQAQAANFDANPGKSSKMIKFIIIALFVILAAGAAVLAYPYINSMLNEETEEILPVEEEVVVDDAYNFSETEIIDDEVYVDEDVEEYSSDEDLMVEVQGSLSDIISGGADTENKMESDLLAPEEVVTEELSDDSEEVESPVDLNKDTDNDGLTDVEEEKLGTHTMKADTDNDGLSDREEVMTYKTNPAEFDSDGDGLSDGDEINVYKTNALLADTDGDSYTDGVEVNGGYNPNGAGKLEN